MTEKPERPGPDATSAEIMEWMERDFHWAVAEGVEEGIRRKGADDEEKEETDTGN